ncbi:MAG: hypothetical protein JWM29_1234 [Solirubrobacterales bacterium]|jgi:uncharacterized protein YbjT (DUF2867 family)|nr:hypothetical protein [Solirubrobacterales bacterium]
MIVGGGCRGRRLASALISDGQVVRVSTRTDSGRSAIEATGAECWIGTPDRLATLRGALDGVTVMCWLLGSAVGSPEELQALHSSRLEFFLTQAIDTTVRGIVYEAAGTGTSPDLLRRGAEIAQALAERNAIPARFLTADPNDVETWLDDARASIASLL